MIHNFPPVTLILAGMRLPCEDSSAITYGLGFQNTIPWHLPEDLAFFKKHTLHTSVFMGRVTYYSLPLQYRPLPQRLNIVLTQATHPSSSPPHLYFVSTVEEAFHVAQEHNPNAPMMVIGGSIIYKLFQPYAHRALITEVRGYTGSIDTTTHFDTDQWMIQNPEEPWNISQKTPSLSYRFLYLEKKTE